MEGGIKSVELDLEHFVIITKCKKNVKKIGRVHEGLIRPIFALKK